MSRHSRVDMVFGSDSKWYVEDGQVGWRDLVGQVIVRKAAGVGVPVYEQMSGSIFYAYNFDVGDDVQVIYHVDHDYAVGTAIYLHAHWLTDGTATDSVKWQISVAYADGHGQGIFPLGSPTVKTVEQSPDGTALTHLIAEVADPGFDESFSVDGLIIANYKRVTNGGTDNSDNVYLLTADCHYQADRFATLNKAPNFYK